MTPGLVRELVRGAPAQRIASAQALREHAARDATTDTVERAALGGLAAGGVGWAFACGYEAALTRLDPEATRGGALTALCATEEGGGHPRAIRTTLSPASGGPGWTLSGRKTWVTLGADAERLLVVASAGQREDGRNTLRVARIPATRRGVHLAPAAPLPLAPEIAHTQVTLDAVAVDDAELLPGDGYETVLKPFRTIEDTHVMAAVLGWSIGVGHASAWPRAWIEEAVALVVLLRGVNALPPLQSETHLILAGAIAGTLRLLESAAWSRADAATRDGWERDRALLRVASTARAARLESAWRALSGG